MRFYVNKWSFTSSAIVPSEKKKEKHPKTPLNLLLPFSFFGDYSDWCETYNFTFKFAASKNSFSSWHHTVASENQTVVITNRVQLHSDTE